MQVTIHVTGLDRTEERLSRLGASLHDFTGALTELGKALIIFYSQTVFTGSGTPLGKRWKPLAASTQAEKEREWRGAGMLVRTGAMQGGFYSEVTPGTLFISNSVPYFPYHQLGTGVGRGGADSTSLLGGLGIHYGGGGTGRGRNLPARPMIGVSPAVERIIKRTLEADIKKKIESTNI